MKITVIIPTGESPADCFIRSLCSLIINSDKEIIDSIIVSINGPDSRTGSTTNQDRKEKFCLSIKEELNYPIKVVRTWSRIGFSQPISMCIPLVKTEYYLLMQDDVMVLNKDWQREAMFWLEENNVEAIVSLPVFDQSLLTRLNGMFQKERSKPITHFLSLPSISTVFSIFRSSSNLIWKDFLIDLEEKIKILEIKDFFKNYMSSVTLLPGEIPKRKSGMGLQTYLESVNGGLSELLDVPWESLTEEQKNKLINNSRKNLLDKSHRYRKWRCISIDGLANRVSYKTGSWAAYQILKSNKKIAHFSRVIHHIENMTNKESRLWENDNPDIFVRSTIKKIEKSFLNKIYSKHTKKISSIKKFKVKPLLCIQVYDRAEDVKNWINVWKKSIKFGGKLLIVQNYDETKECIETSKIIEQLNPDFYWKRKNDNQLLHIFELVENKFKINYDWNVLFTFIDDIYPLRKDFLWPMIIQFHDENLGITGGYKKAANKNKNINNETIPVQGRGLSGKFLQRNVALAIRKCCLEKVNEKILNTEIKKRRDFSYLFESRIGDWVEKVGYKWKASDYEWPFIFGWDVDNNIQENLFEKAHSNIEKYKSNLYDLNQKKIK